MINIRTLRKLTNNDGLTLKNGKVITYKSGWQVATEGLETTDQKEAMQMIKAYNGNCGVWFADGIYYIDKSHRVNTKREAMEVGRACNQISVLCWRNMKLAYCQKIGVDIKPLMCYNKDNPRDLEKSRSPFSFVARLMFAAVRILHGRTANAFF